MTNHAELSKALALALGYAPESVKLIGFASNYCSVYRKHKDCKHPGWYAFDYRDPSVAMPLLVWLMVEYGHDAKYTRFWDGGGKVFCVSKPGSGVYPWSDTLEEVIARACIAVGGK